ncbi:precorrin-8X methylmutase [Thermosulfurimonas marina]|uniref:Precorrin-8X methylmutase n=1 Tax=Thermosulfurimonas marina TaxID=2047767 RepID=A0A6H1WTF2_9BACT|nr:precorrin-8X methylmutase [Thermosulfurimonas marina]QJA06429.1 precorrin-8X methylmutase [Thermosulfurimonas marina]
MGTVFIAVVERNIRGLPPELKGRFEVVSPEDLSARLEELSRRGVRRVHLAFLGPRPVSLKIPPGMEIRDGREALSDLEAFPEPAEIEAQSFEILRGLCDLSRFPQALHPLVLRLVHAAGELALAESLLIHPDFLPTARRLLKEGRAILTDVEMVRAGISRRLCEALGVKVYSALSEAESPPSGFTRTAWGLRRALEKYPEISLLALGNAPTALLEALKILRESPREVAVIGFPVGFVRAAEAKLLLAESPLPHLTNLGGFGGSALAAAAVNALLHMLHEEKAS